MSDYEEYDDDATFTVNVHEVVKSPECMAITRLLAANLISDPYMTVRHWLVGLSTEDLSDLLALTEDQDDPHFADLILIAEMLATAEGLDPGTLSESTLRVNVLTGFLAVESLDRKGLAKARRENMSFGEDMKHKIILEKIDG